MARSKRPGRSGPLSSQSLRSAAERARSAARAAAAARANEGDAEWPDAALVAQRVYRAAVEARETGEAGDVSPLLWAPLVTAAEMMASVVVAANDLEAKDEELRVDIAAYFVAMMLAAGQGFDREHFDAWRTRPVSDELPHDAADHG